MASSAPLDVKTMDGLVKALLVLSRAVNHVLENRAVEEAVGEPLSSSKVQILRLLAQRGGQSSSRVAFFLAVSKPAVSQIIGSMVRDKLVMRQTSKHDRREVELRLTAKGKEWYQALRRQQRHLLRTAVRKHLEGPPERWIDALQQVASAVVQADKAFEDYCLQCGAHTDGSCLLLGKDTDCPFLKRARPTRSAQRRRS